jgi:sugar phosphate isomerase/epimerase
VEIGATHRVEIDAPAGADDVAAAAAFARARLLDVVAVTAPFFGRAEVSRREEQAHLGDEDPSLLEQARREIRAAIRVAADFRAPRVVVSPGILAPREAPNAASLREAAVERMCRELWGILREEEGLRLLLRPESDPERTLGVEEFSWIFGEFAPGTLGLALDLGAVQRRHLRGGDARDDWEGAFAERLELLYLSDANEVEEGLPLGVGQVDAAWIARLRERGLTCVLKLSEGLPRLVVEESLRQLG